MRIICICFLKCDTAGKGVCTGLNNELFICRGTVIVAMVECSSRQNWSELAEMASVKWADKLSCHFDALIVLFHQWKLIPVLSIRRNSSALWRQLQLRSYQVLVLTALVADYFVISLEATRLYLSAIPQPLRYTFE